MMITSAGRLRKKMSQLSKKRSAPLWRPRKSPIADPISIASAKLTMTRASVAPTCVSSEPTRISRMNDSSTCSGPGKRRLESSSAATSQTATSASSEPIDHAVRPSQGAAAAAARSARIEEVRVEMGTTAQQLLVAELDQKARQLLGGTGFGRTPALRYATPVIGPERRELGIVGRLDEVAQPLPGGVAGGEDLVAVPDGREEAGERLFLSGLDLLAPHE